MSEWRERFAGSQAVALTRALVELAPRLPSPVTDAEVDAQARIRAGLDVTKAIILGANPQLVTERMLQAPVTPLSQVQNALNAYVATADVAQLASANSYLEIVLDTLSIWLQRPAREARQTVAALQRDASDVIEHVRMRALELEDAINESKNEISETRREIAALVESAKEELATGLQPVSARQTELNAEISSQKGRLDAAIAQFQQQFSTAEAQRAEQSTAAIARLTEEHAQFMLEQRTAAAQLADEARKGVQALFEEMRRSRDDARKVLSALGAEAASGGFLGQAEAEHRAADRWRRVGVGLVVLVAGWGVATILTTGAAEFTLQWLTGRLLVAVPLVGIGLYALAESGRHRDREWRSRRAELDLTALDPFVALMGEDKRNELKYELAKRAFLATQDDHARPGDDVVGRLLDIISDAVKRK